MIDIVGLRKSYRRLEVLRGIDLRLLPGRVTAVIGPNGSGKTTLIKCILGLVHADEGDVFIHGRRIDRTGAYRQAIGYMPQAARFPENLSGREVIELLKRMRTNDSEHDERLVDEFALGSDLDKPFRTLSGGGRQKLSAVVAFLFDPDALILDEPTAGLDPLASSVLKDRIEGARSAGKTLLLSSHVMGEIEELADHVVFLLDGTIVIEGAIEAVKKAAGEVRLERAVARLMQGDSWRCAAA